MHAMIIALRRRAPDVIIYRDKMLIVADRKNYTGSRGLKKYLSVPLTHIFYKLQVIMFSCLRTTSNAY